MRQKAKILSVGKVTVYEGKFVPSFWNWDTTNCAEEVPVYEVVDGVELYCGYTIEELAVIAEGKAKD